VALFFFLIIAAIVLGLIGVLAHGLLYLLIIGIVVLVIDLIYAGIRFRRGGRRAPR
jgi:hypothetical protein